MKTTSRLNITSKCKLCLPEFNAENQSEETAAMLMNRFSSLLEENIKIYADSTPDVRTYSANFYVVEDNDATFVHILLCARVLIPVGKIKFCKRKIVCRWKGSRLMSVNSI